MHFPYEFVINIIKHSKQFLLVFWQWATNQKHSRAMIFLIHTMFSKTSNDFTKPIPHKTFQSFRIILLTLQNISRDCNFSSNYMTSQVISRKYNFSKLSKTFQCFTILFQAIKDSSRRQRLYKTFQESALSKAMQDFSRPYNTFKALQTLQDRKKVYISRPCKTLQGLARLRRYYNYKGFQDCWRIYKALYYYELIYRFQLFKTSYKVLNVLEHTNGRGGKNCNHVRQRIAWSRFGPQQPNDRPIPAKAITNYFNNLNTSTSLSLNLNALIDIEPDFPKDQWERNEPPPEMEYP